MFASVSTYRGPPGQIDDGLRYAQENIVPSLREVEGFEGVYLLLDRRSGKVLTITLWESEEALRASEEEATRLRGEHGGRWDRVPTAEAGGQEVAGVESYEVAISAERSQPRPWVPVADVGLARLDRGCHARVSNVKVT